MAVVAPKDTKSCAHFLKDRRYDSSNSGAAIAGIDAPPLSPVLPMSLPLLLASLLEDFVSRDLGRRTDEGG